MRSTLPTLLAFCALLCQAASVMGQSKDRDMAMMKRSNNATATSAELARFKEMLAKYKPLQGDELAMGKVENSDNSALFEVRIDIPELGQVQITAVLFAALSHEVEPVYTEWLDHYAKTLARYPLAHVRIEAHTDSVGSASANMVLSELRALEVKNQLVQRGIAGSRIFAHGMGEQMPVASNLAEEGRRKNRRVEFRNYFPVVRH